MDEVKKIVRALLISTKNGLTVNELCSEYSSVTGTALPYKELGFFSAVELVKDMPDVVRPIFLSGGVMLLKGIADDSTAHINQLVKRQKSVRRNTKIVVNQVAKPVKLVVPDYVRNKLLKLIEKYQKGVSLQLFEEVYKRSYGRRIDYSAIGFSSVKEVLGSCSDIIQIKQVSSNTIFLYPIQPFCPDNFTFASLKAVQKKPLVNNITLPQSMKMEIYSLLTKHSNYGLPASKFLFEYENCFKKSFKLHSSGFHSIIEMMSKIPDIVSIERPQSGGDWTLRAVLSDEKLPAIVTKTAQPLTVPVKNGDVIDLYISYIISPSSFWYQEEKTVNELEEVMEKMNDFLNSEKSFHYSSVDFHAGQFCCALYEEDKRWYRAVVKRIISKECVKVQYIDYGNESVVKTSSLRLMLQDFYSLPQQAHHGKIANVIPKNDIWSEPAIKEFFNVTQDQQLSAKIVKIERVNSLDLTLFDDSTQNIGDMLSAKGYCVQLHNNPTVPYNATEKIAIQPKQHDQEQINNLKNFYQQYYQALKDVSTLSSANPSPTTVKIESNQGTKEIKSIQISENITLHFLNHSNRLFVSSAEFSNLFWNADILRQMARQKGISLTRVLLTSEDSPKFFDLLVKENVYGLNNCGGWQSLSIYEVVELLPLFEYFKSKFGNSKSVVEKEVALWNQLKNNYWNINNIQLSESESNALQIQALQFKKKRLYMSMITNKAKPGVMDELLSIEKEINCLTLR